jgi:hypothetical protein
MRSKKSIVIMVFIGLGIFSLVLAMQYYNSVKINQISDNEKDIPIFDNEVRGEQKEANIPNLKVQQLNTMQKEIESLSDAVLAKEISELKEKIQGSDLIERLNRNSVSAEEKESAKKLFTRLALLNVEKSKRQSGRSNSSKNKTITQHIESLNQ